MILNVNNKEVENYTKRLRNMHRSDFPVAVRQTLNDMAFDVKQNQLLKSADKVFILRNPSFFRKYSGVSKANGWNVNTMKSQVGIIPGTNEPAKKLVKQEYGGTITNRSMIYMNTARISRSKMKRVRKQNYIGTKGIVRGDANKSRSEKSQFVANAFIAKKYNLFLFQDDTLFDVEDIKTRSGTSRKVFVRMTPIADYEKNRSVNLQSRPFLRPASMITYQKQSSYYIKNAKKRFEKKR